MLIGEYVHTLDDKKRVSLPAKFRREVGKKVVITNGLDKCLFVYTMPQWEKLAQKLSELSLGRGDTRGFSRFMLASAYETEVDLLGRVLIPDSLKEFAELKQKVVIAGVYGRIEIWNEKSWQKYKANIGKGADDMAEKLGEIGAV
ncbi:MAG: division/cell wall cluster transcriptional repressor MraZ [Patescibacteria group bacterium]